MLSKKISEKKKAGDKEIPDITEKKEVIKSYTTVRE